MHSPAWPVDVNDDGMMHHAIYDGGCNDGITEVISELAKPYVRSKHRCPFAVAAVYDLEEQGGVP